MHFSTTGLSDDHKIETTRDIHQRVSDELEHAGLPDIHLSFHLTSIYDHSIFEVSREKREENKT